MRCSSMSQQLQAQMGFTDQGQALAQKKMMLAPEGHAGLDRVRHRRAENYSW